MPQTRILSTTTPRARAGLFAQLRVAVTTALTRRRERAMLARLDAHLLRDIGLDQPAATAEAQKPFWRA